MINVCQLLHSMGLGINLRISLATKYPVSPRLRPSMTHFFLRLERLARAGTAAIENGVGFISANLRAPFFPCEAWSWRDAYPVRRRVALGLCRRFAKIFAGWEALLPLPMAAVAYAADASDFEYGIWSREVGMAHVETVDHGDSFKW